MTHQVQDLSLVFTGFLGCRIIIRLAKALVSNGVRDIYNGGVNKE